MHIIRHGSVLEILWWKCVPYRLQAILSEIEVTDDWSAVIVEDATIDDLDAEAIEKARKEFVKRNPLKKGGGADMG